MLIYGRVSKHIMLVSFVLLYSCLAFGQEVDFEGERPTEPIFDRYGGPKSCWIIKEEAIFFDSPEESEVIGIGKFLDTYYVAREKKVKGKEYLLLAKVDKNYKITDFVGWIRSDDGLTDREALKTEYSIYRKALIINQWRKAKEATVYKGPGEEYEKVKQLGLFRFYYIYKRGGRPGGGDYLLLGSHPTILADKRPQDVIIGWVNAERIYVWDTRQAIEIKKDNIDERKEPVKIFKNIEDLEYHLKGITKHPITGEPIEPVAVEDMNVKEWPYYLQRWPIMSSQPSDFGVRLFQVGYVGHERQIFDTGAIAEIDPKTGKQQTEIVVLLSRDEIILLSAILSGFTQNVSTPKSILDLWKEILEKHLGEKYDTNIPLNEYIRKHLGLQVQENLLKYPLVKIARLIIDQIRELQSSLKEKLGDLNDIQSERIVIKKKDKGKTVRKVLPGRKKRFWIEGDMEFAWIPINALP